jgi:tetratricopeptide (TPR) repeat protein
MNPLLREAGIAHSEGRHDRVRAICDQVLQTEPENPQALLLLGVTEAQVGDPGAAVKLLSLVQALDPSSFQAPYWLSFALKRQGRHNEAIAAAHQALAIKPEDPQAIANLGLCLMEARLLRPAETCFRRSLEADSTVPSIHFSLSRCLRMAGKSEEADAALRRALNLFPLSFDSLLQLGNQFLGANDPAGAVLCADKALQKKPGNPLATLLGARAALEDIRIEDAKARLERANLGELDAQAANLRGMVEQALGHLDEAQTAFQDSVAKDPNQGFGYFSLVSNRRATETDRPLLEQMRALAASSLPDSQRAYLQYGLGKAYEDLGENAPAMAAYDEANRIERQRQRPMSRVRYATRYENTRQTFHRDLLARAEELGSSDETPIFVLGMIRSGTTLVEQILSCHPDVGPAGEQPFWSDNWREAFGPEQKDADAEALKDLATRYVASVKRLLPDSQRFVDKMPGNFAGIGIIHLALPKARIIHVRRNPLDNCVSIYVTPNRAAHEFAHDRPNIGFAYREYQKLMDHWRACLPEGAMLEIDYEDLVADRETVTRRLLSYCGLTWNEACLEPHRNKRPVTTPSVWQVRLPVYKTAIDRWRKFEPWAADFGEFTPRPT